jgi:putative Holliday junction resolvase
VQQIDTPNPALIPAGRRIIGVDPGTKRVGIAVCDETQLVARPLSRIQRTSWKKLLEGLRELILEFDAAAIVIGLPLESDGSESTMSGEARRLARNLGLSVTIPVFLQDERTTSYEAKRRLWERDADLDETKAQVDSEAAAIILEDFLERLRAARSE